MGACSAKEKKPTADSVPPKPLEKTEEPKPANGTNGTAATAATPANDTAAQTPAAEPDLSQKGLLASDAELVSKRDQFSNLAQRFNVAASDDTLEATKTALEAKKFVVKIVDDAKEALGYITAIPKDGQSISSGGSRTLDEIGYKDWAKSQTSFKDFKAEAINAESKGDWGNASRYRKEGSNADVFFTSCAAVTQDGAILWGSMSGTRLSLNAGVLVVVAGSQKVVPDEAAGEQRMYEWQLPLESARARVVYKIPGSNLNEVGTLRQLSPYAAAGSVHIVLVRGVWGY